MKTGKIQLTNIRKVAKILNRNNYLLFGIGIIFLLVDYDLFSSQPKFLITEGFFWKGIAMAFQIIFIATLLQWEYKKQKIIDILSNGTITNGKLVMSETIKFGSLNRSYGYIHLFEYHANNKKHEVSLKTKRNSVKTNYIIYQSNNPKKAIAYEELKTELKKLIEEKA